MSSKLHFLYKHLLLFIIGGSLYYCIEILFRGYSHWTMLLAGGLIFLYAGWQNEIKPWNYPLWKQILKVWGLALIIEFLTGCVVNLRLGWRIWDYSELPMNLLGQVCVPFALLFLPLCAAAIMLDDYIRYWIFQEEKPRYKWF